jgi:ribosomal protein L29
MVTNNADKKKLTIEDLKKMTKEQIAERIEEARAALEEYFAEQRKGGMKQ